MGSQDDLIFIPITTLKKRLFGSRFPNSVQSIAIKIFQDADNNVVIDQITAMLRQRHRLKTSDDDDFQITDMNYCWSIPKGIMLIYLMNMVFQY